MTLIEWLRAQLDDDERVAQDAESACSHVDYCDDWGRAFDERFDPARVLAEVDAKRRIITAIHDRKTWRSDPPPQFIDLDIESRVLELLALPYAGKEGYDESWRP